MPHSFIKIALTIVALPTILSACEMTDSSRSAGKEIPYQKVLTYDLQKVPKNLESAEFGLIDGTTTNEVYRLEIKTSCSSETFVVSPLENRWRFELATESNSLCGPKMRINIAALDRDNNPLQDTQIRLGGF